MSRPLTDLGELGSLSIVAVGLKSHWPAGKRGWS